MLSFVPTMIMKWKARQSQQFSNVLQIFFLWSLWSSVVLTVPLLLIYQHNWLQWPRLSSVQHACSQQRWLRRGQDEEREDHYTSLHKTPRGGWGKETTRPCFQDYWFISYTWFIIYILTLNYFISFIHSYTMYVPFLNIEYVDSTQRYSCLFLTLDGWDARPSGHFTSHQRRHLTHLQLLPSFCSHHLHHLHFLQRHCCHSCKGNICK